jgi:hypothetical protein
MMIPQHTRRATCRQQHVVHDASSVVCYVASLALLFALAPVTTVKIEWSSPALIGGTGTAAAAAAATAGGGGGGGGGDAAPSPWPSPSPPQQRGVKGPIGFGMNFRAFDSRHFLGPAFNNTWAFSSDAGATWRTVAGAVVSEKPSPRKPTGIDSDGWAAIADMQLPPATPGGPPRTLGGGDPALLRDGSYSRWTLNGRREFTLTHDGGSFVMSSPDARNVTFSGIPYPGASFSGYGSGERNFGIARMADGRYVMQTAIIWNGLRKIYPKHQRPPFSVLAFVSSDSFNWQYAATVANWSSLGIPKLAGPNESDLTVLADNKTLMSVSRMDGDGSCATPTTTTYKYYHASFSTDNAATWSHPKQIDGAGCVLPRLHLLPGGPLVLSGGRLCVEGVSGLFLWVNADVSSDANSAFVQNQVASAGDKVLCLIIFAFVCRVWAVSMVVMDGRTSSDIRSVPRTIGCGKGTHVTSSMKVSTALILGPIRLVA